MYTQEEENIIVLSTFDELTQATKIAIFNKLTSGVPDFTKVEKNLIKNITEVVYNKVRELYNDSFYRSEVIKSLNQKGIKCVTFLSKDYPESFKKLPSPPVLLYCKGDTTLLKSQCFAMVGSRKTMEKTILDSKQVAGELSKCFTMVTGIAEGGDTAVIEGVCEKGGKIICIIASGVDKVYPASAAKLFRSVEKCGLLVSEYPPQTMPQPFFFPVRNRLIAGLAEGVLVVSAGEKSGALITANYAKEYKKKVFAFPYNIGVPSGVGCNALLKSGGILVENAQDVFKEFGIEPKNEQPQINLEGIELLIYQTLLKEGELHLSAIAEKVGKKVHEVMPIMCGMQIKKLVTVMGGNKWIAIKK